MTKRKIEVTEYKFDENGNLVAYGSKAQEIYYGGLPDCLIDFLKRHIDVEKQWRIYPIAKKEKTTPPTREVRIYEVTAQLIEIIV